MHPPGRARRQPGAAVGADGVNGVCIVMQGPEGNEFCLDCVGRGSADRTQPIRAGRRRLGYMAASRPREPIAVALQPRAVNEVGVVSVYKNRL